MATSRNPYAGVTPHPFTTDEVEDPAIRCSTITGENLPGTAKPGKIVLAVEFYTGWGRDILDGDALGKDLTARMKKFLKHNGAELQFIRGMGREGQNRKDNDTRVLYIAWASGTNPVLERMDIPDVEAILDLDLSSPGNTPGAWRVEHPILLVCTHGKRDRCCAISGRPLAAAMNDHFAESQFSHPENVPSHDKIDPLIWESSHTKGHRFAPSMLLLPANYSFGRMADTGSINMFEHALHDQLWLQGNRGRGCLDQPSQVAQIAVARKIEDAGGEVRLASLESWDPEESDGPQDAFGDRGKPKKNKGKTTKRIVEDTLTGRRYAVDLERHEGVMVMSSCGDRPKKSSSWVVMGLNELADR